MSAPSVQRKPCDYFVGERRTRSNSLAMEIGDMLAAMDDPLGAAEEWALAVGDDGSQISTVIRRVQALTKESEEAGKRVVEILASSAMSARRKAAAPSRTRFEHSFPSAWASSGCG